MGDTTKDLRQAIMARRATIERLRRELEILERAQALLNGVGRIRITAGVGTGKSHALVLGEILTTTSGARTPRPPSRRDRFNPKGGVASAVAVLKAAGVPLRVDAILAQARKIGYRGQEGSLSSTIARFAKKRRIFAWTAPYTFGLLEWEQAKKET